MSKPKKKAFCFLFCFILHFADFVICFFNDHQVIVITLPTASSFCLVRDLNCTAGCKHYTIIKKPWRNLVWLWTEKGSAEEKIHLVAQAQRNMCCRFGLNVNQHNRKQHHSQFFSLRGCDIWLLLQCRSHSLRVMELQHFSVRVNEYEEYEGNTENREKNDDVKTEDIYQTLHCSPAPQRTINSTTLFSGKTTEDGGMEFMEQNFHVVYNECFCINLYYSLFNRVLWKEVCVFTVRSEHSYLNHHPYHCVPKL